MAFNLWASKHLQRCSQKLQQGTARMEIFLRNRCRWAKPAGQKRFLVVALCIITLVLLEAAAAGDTVGHGRSRRRRQKTTPLLAQVSLPAATKEERALLLAHSQDVSVLKDKSGATRGSFQVVFCRHRPHGSPAHMLQSPTVARMDRFC